MTHDLQLNLWTQQDSGHSGHSVLVQFNHTQSREILEHGISVTKRGFGFSTRKTVGGSLQQPVAQKLWEVPHENTQWRQTLFYLEHLVWVGTILLKIHFPKMLHKSFSPCAADGKREDLALEETLNGVTTELQIINPEQHSYCVDN